MATIDPALGQLDLSIRQNVTKMIQDAYSQYHRVIKVNQTLRTPEQAQTFHVLHMFLKNFFASRTPKFVETGKRTISWDHLKDPAVTWQLIDGWKKKCLLTATGTPAVLQANATGGPAWVTEPDRVQSTAAMNKYLNAHGVHKAAAPGIDGCG